MARITETEAAAVLRPYRGVLVELPFGAWARWEALDPRARLDLSHPTARANVLWGFFNGEAKRALGDLAGVQIVERDRRPRFIFQNRMLVRLKKLAPNGLGSNYPTQRSLQFDQQLELEGEEFAFQLPRVDIGYVLNPLSTGVSDVLAVHRNGTSVLWSMTLTGQAEVISIDRDAADDQKQGRRFRARDSDSTVGGQGTDGD